MTCPARSGTVREEVDSDDWTGRQVASAPCGSLLHTALSHPFKTLAIDVRQERVRRVDPANRITILSNGHEIAYDRLLIATGAHPVEPPIEGIDSEWVENCWTLADARRILAGAKPGSRVVLMGAGFIGCIVLEALAAHGEDDRIVGALALGLTQHVGVVRGLIQTRVRLGAWMEKLRADPARRDARSRHPRQRLPAHLAQRRRRPPQPARHPDRLRRRRGTLHAEPEGGVSGVAKARHFRGSGMRWTVGIRFQGEGMSDPRYRQCVRFGDWNTQYRVTATVRAQSPHSHTHTYRAI